MYDRKEYMREYNQRPEVKQMVRESVQRYALANPLKIKEKKRKYFTLLMRRERHFLQRMGILSYYSNPQGRPICNNCGEREFDALCLDHIYGGGGKERKELNSNSTHFWTWLERNNYPAGYQVLCANCNQRKLRIDRARLKLKAEKSTGTSES